MLTSKSKLSSAAVAGAVAATLLLPVGPAQAMQQTWSGSASYRASRDFLPAATRITVGGKSCTANFGFKLELVKTRASERVWTSATTAADGQWRGYGGISANTSTAYYVRWRSDYGSSSCQGIEAFPSQ